MIRLLLILSLLVVSSPIFSMSPPERPSRGYVQDLPPEEKSKWEFGLGLNIGYETLRGLVISLNPSAQYFVVKKLSIGGFLQYYHDDSLNFISAGPSATYFIIRQGPYSVVLNQRVRFREYIKPSGLNASKLVSMTTLAADWGVGGGLSMRLGIGYKKSLDGKTLAHNGIEENEWVFPTFGFAYYL